MKQFILFTSVLLLSLSCQQNAITGRKSLNLVPSSAIMSMSATNYRQFLSENKLSTNATQTQMVKNAGQRIKTAVETYYKEKGLSSKLAGYNWEFNLVEDPTVNAWCMPGGKVVFYTGIMPIAQDETGVAVIMGHEVAHAVAEHGNERMSQGLIQTMGGVALSVALANKPKETQELFLGAYGIGTTLGVILPFSRMHESEADHMGLIFMAMAGYDPREAPKFWERMKAKGGGGRTPEFLSTHPSDTRRIADLNKWMPEAMKYYKPR
ncbi:MAG: M48 family metallopeptidase [Cytophagaceae bacterium]|nr:M48 family metallopeptidase [Cytophagaceae bacterium]MDW8455218.1 M48 family metallopeptidase [Cytophagaceae bacterium]